MSAAKMVADSTQADVPELSGTKRRKKMVQKKKVKKKKEKETSKKTKKKTPEREFDESDLDLEKEIHPIGYFVKNREGLLEELFHCVKGPSMERALPEVLQDLPVDELKQRCLQQLLVMSKKRIRRILAGDDPSTISSSGTEDDTSEEELQEMDDEDDGNEAHVVDSTSLYEQSMELSDRAIDDDDDDSMVHSTLSPYPSDTEQQYQHQYEEESEQEYPSGNEYTDVVESECNSRQSVVVKEDPEEGEVFDDSDEEPGSNIKAVTDSQAVFDGNDDNEPEYNVETFTDGRKVLAVGTGTKNDFNVVNKPECADQDVAETDGKLADAGGKVASADEVLAAVNVDQEVTDADREVAGTDQEMVSAEGVVACDNEEVAGADRKVIVVAETKTDIGAESGSVANKDPDMEVEDIITCEGETSESITVTADNKSVHEDESVELDKPGNVPTDKHEESVEENVVEISIEDLDDEQFVQETREKSESAQFDGDLTEEEISQSDKTEVKASASTSSVQRSQPPRRIVKPPKQDIAPALTRNQMELLELEMRARAIKAMLKTAK